MNTTNLQALLSNFINPTPQEWNIFFECLTVQEFKKGETLNKEGDLCNQLYFIEKGLARHFFHDVNNFEITTWFNAPGSLTTDFASFTTGVKSVFQIEAITPVECITISNVKLQMLYDKSKVWERMGRLINQVYLTQLIERNNSMICKTASQRYEDFKNTQGELFNIVPLKFIASYLDITIETLSRLRSNTY